MKKNSGKVIVVQVRTSGLSPKEQSVLKRRLCAIAKKIGLTPESPEKTKWVPKKKTELKIDIKKVAKGLGAEIITDPKKIAEMKKKKYPWRPE